MFSLQLLGLLNWLIIIKLLKPPGFSEPTGGWGWDREISYMGLFLSIGVFILQETSPEVQGVSSFRVQLLF